jgi:hypothetical protein
MNLKKIAILSALLFLLAAFYYFYEVRHEATQKDKAEALKKVLDLDGDNLERISLKNPKGTVVLEKKGKDWFLAEPIRTQADSWVVEQIVDTLADSNWEREVTPFAKDFADFGLAEPEFEVALSVKGPSKPGKVIVGRENPAGNMRYIRVNQQERVLLVPTRFKDVLDKSVDDLRDKRILRFEQDLVVKMHWRVEKKNFLAEKKENKWRLVEPAGEKISESRIRGLIWRLE